MLDLDKLTADMYEAMPLLSPEEQLVWTQAIGIILSHTPMPLADGESLHVTAS
jgi:hypothetical protein